MTKKNNMDKNKNQRQGGAPAGKNASAAGLSKYYDENGGLRRDNTFFLVGLLVFFAGVFIDLVTKAWAEYYFEVLGNGSFELIPGFMALAFTYNPGMAFGWFSDSPVFMDVVTWATPVIVLLFLFFAWRLPKAVNPHRVCLCLAASGAFGNFLDRVLVADGVRDFMDISSIGFGICNFADYFSTFGLIVLILCILFVGEESLFPIIGRRKRAKADRERDERE